MRLTDSGIASVRDRRARRHAHLVALWVQLDESERKGFLNAVDVLLTVAEKLDSRSHRDLERNKLADSPAKHRNGVRRELPTVEETLAHFTAGEANEAAACHRRTEQ